MMTLSVVPDDTTIDAWAAGVKRLQRMLPPKGFAIDRWAMICTDCPRLLEQHGADLRRLGWATTDAFGAHPHAPAAAVRCYSLGLLMNGGSLVDLSEQGATISLPSGAQHRFVRVGGKDAVPLWDVRG